MILNGDCIEEMEKLDDNSIDAMLTDPPYGLAFMDNKWDSFTPKGYQDFTEKWASVVYKKMKPGAYGLVFGGGRTSHRLTCGLEDAGFKIKDVIMWIYVSGFPKGQDVFQFIDKKLGHESKRGEMKMSPDGIPYNKRQIEGHTMTLERVYGETIVKADHWYDLVPVSDEAKMWYGYRTGLKPAWEPIILIQKKKEGTFANNILKWGVGALNIDGCRVPINLDIEEDARVRDPEANFVRTLPKEELGGSTNFFEKSKKEGYIQKLYNLKGRYPTNIIIDELIAELMDDVYGVSDGGKFTLNKEVNRDPDGSKGVWSKDRCGYFKSNSLRGESISNYGDKGGISKSFFKTPTTKFVYGEWSGKRSDCHYGLRDGGGISKFFYVPKASPRERSIGLEEIEPQKRDTSRQAHCDVPQNRNNPVQNFHPTVKPIKLLTYLIRMIKPPTKNPCIIDPFAGSGSTGIACKIENCDYILIEKEDKYMEILKKRMEVDIMQYQDFTDSVIAPINNLRLPDYDRTKRNS